MSADDFERELSTVTNPISKTKIETLTKLALQNVKHYKLIVYSVEKFILKSPAELLLPALYVMHSTLQEARRKLGSKDVFAPRFSKNLKATLSNLRRASESDQAKIKKVVTIWANSGIFSKDLCNVILNPAASQPAANDDKKTLLDDFDYGEDEDDSKRILEQQQRRREEEKRAAVPNAEALAQLLSGKISGDPSQLTNTLSQLLQQVQKPAAPVVADPRGPPPLDPRGPPPLDPRGPPPPDPRGPPPLNPRGPPPADPRGPPPLGIRGAPPMDPRGPPPVLGDPRGPPPFVVDPRGPPPSLVDPRGKPPQDPRARVEDPRARVEDPRARVEDPRQTAASPRYDAPKNGAATADPYIHQAQNVPSRPDERFPNDPNNRFIIDPRDRPDPRDPNRLSGDNKYQRSQPPPLQTHQRQQQPAGQQQIDTRQNSRGPASYTDDNFRHPVPEKFSRPPPDNFSRPPADERGSLTHRGGASVPQPTDSDRFQGSPRGDFGRSSGGHSDNPVGHLNRPTSHADRGEFDSPSHMGQQPDRLPAAHRSGPGGPPRRMRDVVVLSTTVWLGNLPERLDEQRLRRVVEPFGRLVTLQHTDKKRCAFANFMHRVDAVRALTELKDFNLNGQRIKVNWGRGRGQKAYKDQWDWRHGVTAIKPRDINQENLATFADGCVIDRRTAPPDLLADLEKLDSAVFPPDFYGDRRPQGGSSGGGGNGPQGPVARHNDARRRDSRDEVTHGSPGGRRNYPSHNGGRDNHKRPHESDFSSHERRFSRDDDRAPLHSHSGQQQQQHGQQSSANAATMSQPSTHHAPANASSLIDDGLRQFRQQTMTSAGDTTGNPADVSTAQHKPKRQRKSRWN